MMGVWHFQGMRQISVANIFATIDVHTRAAIPQVGQSSGIVSTQNVPHGAS